MADIVKIFAEIGEAYGDELTPNQILKQKFDKILCYGIEDASESLIEYDSLKDRLFLRIISPNGGNLYPILRVSEDFDKEVKNGIKGFNAISNSLKNMVKYLSDSEKELFLELEPHICIESIFQSAKPKAKEKGNYLLALFDKSPMDGGKSFSEIFPTAAESYSEQICKTDGVSFSSACFINGKTKVGFDPMLPFCSTNELPEKLAKTMKPRLLPLGSAAASAIRFGFEKIFKDSVSRAFKFNLFGQSYILLPTVLQGDRREIYNKICSASAKTERDIQSKSRLEEKLQFLIGDEQFSDSMLLTFLFYKQNNSEITLYQTIEDVAPSRIKRASKLMDEDAYDIEASVSSKYVKKANIIKNAVYIRDYIDGIDLAKLIFGTAAITDPNVLYRIINNKILHGNNDPKTKTKYRIINNKLFGLSSIINGAFPDDVNFVKHQRFLDFLHSCSGLENKIINHIGADMKFLTLHEMLEWKFSNVDLLKTPKAKELYILGALAKLVMNWQFKNNSTSLSDYLDSIGSVNVKNRERVFTRIYKAARSYQVYGNDYDYLLEHYSAAKSAESNANITVDTANIAFVMGSIDYKSVKDNLKEIKNAEQSETV